MEPSEGVKEYESWSIDDVSKWLEKIVKLPQYKSTFADLAIDGSLLGHIMDDDLQSDFQIKIRLHRIKILEAIKKLNTCEVVKVTNDFDRKVNIGKRNHRDHSEDEKDGKRFLSFS